MNGSTVTNPKILILINKCDLKVKKFQKKDLFNILEENAFAHVIINEVSAKENINVDYIFDYLIGYMTGKIYLLDESQIEWDDSFMPPLKHRSFRLGSRFEEKIPKKRKKECC
jgi:hypothetical protein